MSVRILSIGICFFWGLFILSCNNPEKGFISIPSLLEEQVKEVDTSLYSITKFIYKGTDTIASDTFYIPREEFRNEADAFLRIPDLSILKNAKRFKEESRYDELLQRVIITYTPKDLKNETWQKEELMIAPDPALGDKVTTIIASRIINDRKGLLQEDMLWIMDRSFQVTCTSQLPGEQPVTTTYKVVWNDQD